ncbi:MAG TPA: hypothetical protein VKP13_17835 [Nitrospira sp.]|nr:hypothetical protein [Nitrospira sp.]
MKFLAGMVFLLVLMAAPVRAGEPEAFDPEEPFRQALSQRLLESLVRQALEAFNDHVEISGSLDPDPSKGDREQRLRFRFHPEGKSKSDEHIAAEGWLGPSEDSRRQEFHFRFSVPKLSPGPDTDRFENVL